MIGQVAMCITNRTVSYIFIRDKFYGNLPTMFASKFQGDAKERKLLYATSILPHGLLS